MSCSQDSSFALKVYPVVLVPVKASLPETVWFDLFIFKIAFVKYLIFGETGPGWPTVQTKYMQYQCVSVGNVLRDVSLYMTSFKP